MSLVATFRVLNGLVRDGVIDTYAVAGAVAALNYLEPAVTADLDVLISVEGLRDSRSGLVTLDPILKSLKKAGYANFKEEGLDIEGWPVQFLPVSGPLEAEALAEAIEVEIGGTAETATIRVPILRPEHLVAIALSVGRPKDRLRVVDFIDSGTIDPARLAGILDRHGLRSVWSAFCAQAGLSDPLAIK